ncbi:protein kinase domain-containing protein [Microtetraspora malaysiensis]|uniref:protein kinase domain-containing protein n=1 Tax=Microtetraspora malaysiensis TaxID=161358 RepID=UPI003D8FEFA4
MRRRALSIGVGSHSSEGTDDDDDLPFAGELAKELAQSLEQLGYVAKTHADLPTQQLGDLVLSHLKERDADAVTVIHVISHGRVEERTGALWIPGTDGQLADGLTEVEHWLRQVERGSDGALVLFLLDLCQSGIAARLPWQTALSGGRTRAWVLAACASDRAAFDGRFSQAVINVLRRIGQGDLDIDPALPHIPYVTVARAVREEVNRLADEADADRQQVTGTLVDSTTDLANLAFFPNPAHDPHDPGRRLRVGLDAGLLPFLDDLDEALDARHFIERASGASPFRRAPGFSAPLGCFTGRRKELRRLSWLLGTEPRDTGTATTLGVVTGSPGVGKSALLGVLVCAFHRGLAESTRLVWQHVSRALVTVRGPFAAVHGRGRRLDEIVGSFARQLGMPAMDFPDDLVDAIAALPAPPALILDALDEADNGPLVMEELVIPLARAIRPDGAAASRLIVGVRKYGDYLPLRYMAKRDGYLADLDDQSREVLEDDLEEYVGELLKASTAYADREAVRNSFARGVAASLSATPEQGVRHRWGEYLVAGLFTRHMVATTLDGPIEDAEFARHYGETAPRNLPEVLALDLNHGMPPLLRPLLSALARTYGDGMPLSVLRRVVQVYLDDFPPPDIRELREVLDAGRFYLRQATDEDGTTLYRLFHQGLADHLLGRGQGRGVRAFERLQVSDFLDLLMAPLRTPDGLDWTTGEPYVVRHLLQHAADAGRLEELLTVVPENVLEESAFWQQSEDEDRAHTGPFGMWPRWAPPPDREQTGPFLTRPRRASSPDHGQLDPRVRRRQRLASPGTNTRNENDRSPAGEDGPSPDRLGEIYAAEAWRPEPGLVLGGRWRLTAPPDTADRVRGSLWTAHPAGNPDVEVLVKLAPIGRHGSSTKAGLRRRRALRNDARVNISDPGIRSVLDEGEDQDFAYLVMPHYRPGSLSVHFSALSTPRTLFGCLDLCDQILAGLSTAHSRGFVHLDVKPGNVVLDGDRVRLIDWGLSAPYRTEDPRREAMAGGTPFFASPEQILRPPGWCAPLADLYGVGAVLYWLITGMPPLIDQLGSTHAPRIAHFLEDGGSPTPINEIVSSVPTEVAMLTSQWLSFKPADRLPQSKVPQRAAALARQRLHSIRDRTSRWGDVPLSPMASLSELPTRTYNGDL